MKKQELIGNDNRTAILPEYGRQRLMLFSESFRDLAELYVDREEDFSEQEKDRQAYLHRQMLRENRNVVAQHLKEMSHIMAKVARETYRCRPMGERKLKKLSRVLRESGILLKDFWEMECTDGHMQVSLTMKQIRERNQRLGEREYIAMEDVADYISVALNTRLCVTQNTPSYMTREWNTYYFMEEPRFHILTGVAKAVKETEKVSGDNYSFYEGENGRMTILLSDGMGSGEIACEDSERVIEMTERFLEAGFEAPTTVRLLNEALVAAEREQNMSTLDLCEMDLYSGNCDFIKVGAACTYIKRGHLVDRVSERSLPLGAFAHLEPEVHHRMAQSGDYIIMLSDGIQDALSQGIGEDMLSEIIGHMDYTNPGEIANQILGYCIGQSRGQIRDDMTVLVIGVWDETMENAMG